MASTKVHATITSVINDVMVVEIDLRTLHALQAAGHQLYGTKGLVDTSTTLTPAPQLNQPWGQVFTIADPCQISEFIHLEGYEVRGCQWLVGELSLTDSQTRLKGLGIWLAFEEKGHHQRGRIRTSDCPRSDIIAYTRAFQSKAEFKSCLSGTLVTYVANELSTPQRTDRGSAYYYMALQVIPLAQEEVERMYYQSATKEDALQSFVSVQKQLLYYDKLAAVQKEQMQSYETVLKFPQPQLPMMAEFQLPSVLEGGQALPFRPNTKVLVTTTHDTGSAFEFSARLSHSQGIGTLHLDIASSLRLLHTKANIKYKNFVITPQHDATMEKLQRSFLEKI